MIIQVLLKSSPQIKGLSQIIHKALCFFALIPETICAIYGCSALILLSFLASPRTDSRARFRSNPVILHVANGEVTEYIFRGQLYSLSLHPHNRWNLRNLRMLLSYSPVFSSISALLRELTLFLLVLLVLLVLLFFLFCFSSCSAFLLVLLFFFFASLCLCAKIISTKPACIFERECDSELIRFITDSEDRESGKGADHAPAAHI
ncbi:MAG: hypothetical protein CVV41_00225 [Candidatus Riflebacteria bacterium HGW-Riflebacteria-1]|nr:MAG: hypothetical protein CVV41_00225 [Candidatus Riflebacteria bacterium HGW-Riflebacteria-1]